MAPITAEEALRKAAILAGSDDFGPSGFEDGLERTLDALTHIPLTPASFEATQVKVVSDLAMRCRIEQWHKTHPDIEAQQIEGPVIVCGLPRTGTTATVGMLALDERFRFLRAWEATAPLPPPVAGCEDQDPRLIAAREAAKNYDKPEMHIHDPDGPEEDLAFLSGLNMHAYYGSLPMPEDFLDWWIGEDFGSTYAYHARVLKLLQSQRPPHLWLLKSPPHLFKLEAFIAQYPNAKFVMTHRDPARVIPSVASLQFRMHTDRCIPGSLNKHERGAQCLSFWTEGLRRGIAARAAIGEHRFIDVYNDDVIKKPLDVFEKIYDHLGMDLGSDLLRKLETYSKRNAPGAFGAHNYALEDYGLTAHWVRAAFKDYIGRFSL